MSEEQYYLATTELAKAMGWTTTVRCGGKYSMVLWVDPATGKTSPSPPDPVYDQEANNKLIEWLSSDSTKWHAYEYELSRLYCKNNPLRWNHFLLTLPLEKKVLAAWCAITTLQRGNLGISNE